MGASNRAHTSSQPSRRPITKLDEACGSRPRDANSQAQKKKGIRPTSPVVKYHRPRRAPTDELCSCSRLKLGNGVHGRLKTIPLHDFLALGLVESVVHVGGRQKHLQQSPGFRVLRRPYALEVIKLRDGEAGASVPIRRGCNENIDANLKISFSCARCCCFKSKPNATTENHVNCQNSLESTQQCSL